MRNFLQKLWQNLMVFPLLKLGCKIEPLMVKHALKVRRLLSQKLEYLIWEMRPKARLAGSDADFDRIVHVAAFRLLKPEIFGKAPDFPSSDVPDEEIYDELQYMYSEIETDVDSIVQEISQEPRVSQVLIAYSLIQHFLAMRKKNEAVAEYHLTRARGMEPGVIPLTDKDLYSLKRTMRKEMVALRDIFAARKALKIEFTATEIVALLSVASSFFLISGYLYNRLLFREFGIDVSKFFTLSDYIASSVSQIGATFASAFLSLVAFFWGEHLVSRKSLFQHRYDQKKFAFLPSALVGMSLTFVVLGYFDNVKLFYTGLYLSIILLALFLLPDLCRKYFNKPRPAHYVLLFIVYSFSYLWLSLGYTIDDLRYEELQKQKKYDVEFKENISLPSSDFVLLAANSDFFFFLDENRKVHIYSKDLVQYLEQRQKKVGLNPFFLFPRRNGLD